MVSCVVHQSEVGKDNMEKNYIVTIKVKEEGGGEIERIYNYHDQEVGFIPEGSFFDEKVEDMIDTLQKAKEVKF